ELEHISGELRRTIFDLRTASLETLDPEEIVRSVADELRANSLVAVDLQVTGDWTPVLSPEQAEQLRQIVHEAFSNVLRHARAGRVSVRLTTSRRRLHLEVGDDGIGFDPDLAAERGRTGRAQGLANIRTRAALLRATLRLETTPGQGTRLSLTMPVSATRRRT
ncbi:MAG TPA: ATP-binding protein, partial [Candidatus Limnocylindria bacterium]|nr:ATP-binding protein [Candidatus Limnocylindria bacterium]